MSERIETYSEFWPHYLREHGRRGTRTLHFIGTGLAIILLLTSVATGNLWFFLAAVVSGYAFAWAGHMLIEHNRPATFTYPLWSLLSDFRMFWFWITGKLGDELKKAGVQEEY